MSLITANSLSKSFGAEDLFRDVSFSIAKGARFALVGPNGIGKTTLLRILMGLEEPSSGSVTRARSLRTRQGTLDIVGAVHRPHRSTRRRGQGGPYGGNVGECVHEPHTPGTSPRPSKELQPAGPGATATSSTSQTAVSACADPAY